MWRVRCDGIVAACLRLDRRMCHTLYMATVCIRESAEWRCGRHDAQWDDVQKLSQLNDVPPSTPRLADFRLPPIPRTSTPLPPEACTHPRPCVGLTMAGVPLEMAFKRLSLRSARLCRQCRRSFASTASGRESQSATRAFSGMPCIQRPRSERPANRPPQSTFNPLEPNLRQRHSQIALQTLPPPPPFHQPPSHLPNPPPLPRDNAHPPTSPAT